MQIAIFTNCYSKNKGFAVARYIVFYRLRIQNVRDEPYWMLFRHGHQVKGLGRKLDDLVGFDWTIAGFDDLFEQSLSSEVQSLLRQSNFPQYRLFSQAACIDLAERSDIVTVVPETTARVLIEKRAVDGMPHPGNFKFSVSAAVLYDAGKEPTVEHFVDCL